MNAYCTLLRVLAIPAVVAVAIMVIGSTYGEPQLWSV